MSTIRIDFTSDGAASALRQLRAIRDELQQLSGSLNNNNVAKTLQAQARATAEVAKAEQARSRIQQQTLTNQQEQLRLESQTQRTLQERAKTEQQLAKSSTERTRLQQAQERSTQELLKAEQAKTRQTTAQIRASAAAERASRSLSDSQSGLARSSRSAGDGIGVAGIALGNFAAGAALGLLDALVGVFQNLASATANFAAQVLEVGGQAEQANVAFTTILGSAEDAQEVLGDLSNFAATTPFDLPGIRQAGQQLLAFGFEQDELIDQLGRVGDVAAGVNQPFGELAEIYGKARVQGRLFAEDINQLTGRGIPIIQELATQFGVTEEEVRGLVSTGQVGFDNLEQAFISLTAEGGKFSGLMEAQSKTVPGQISNIQDSFTQFQETLFAAFQPALAEGLSTFVDILEEIATSSGGIDDIADASQRLALALEGNPEIAERLGQAFGSLAREAVEQLALVIDAINALVSNDVAIEQLAQRIEALGQVITFAGQTVRFLIALTEGTANLIDAAGGVPSLGENFKTAIDVILPSAGLAVDALQGLIDIFGNLSEIAISSVDKTVDVLRNLAPQLTPLLNQIENILNLLSSDEEVTAFNGVSQAQEPAAAALSTFSDSLGALRDTLDEPLPTPEVEPVEDALKRVAAATATAIQEIDTQNNNLIADRTEQGASAEELANIEEQALNKRIAANKKGLNELLALQQQGGLSAEDSASVAASILDIEQELSEQRVELAEGAAKRQEDAEKARVDALKDQIEDAEAIVESAQAAREQSLLRLEQSLLASGASEEAIAERVAAERVRIADEAIQEQIDLERQRIATFGEGTDEARDATLAIAELENERIQNQIDGEQEIREASQARQDAEIEAIQDASDLEERKQNIVAETLSLQEDSLSRQNELLQQGLGLAEAAANLQSTVIQGDIAEQQTGLDLLRQQQDIREQIAEIQTDPDGDPVEQAQKIAELEEQRLSVRRQLNALGIGAATTERQIEAELFALQQERFSQEFANLREKQDADRLALEIQIEQNRLANERAIIEAQIAQARLTAEIAIADAQGETGLANALREALGLQGQVISNLERQQQLEDQSAQTIRDTLALQQGAETVSFLNQFATDARNLAGDITDPALAREAAKFAQGVQAIADGSAEAAGEAAKQASGEAAVQLDRASDRLAAAGVRAGEAIVDAARTAGEILSRTRTNAGGVPAFREGGVTPGGLVQVHKDEFMLPPRGTRVVSQAESRALVRESLSPVTAIATQGNDGRLLRAVTKLERTIRNMPAPQLNQQNYFPVDDQDWRRQSNRNALDMWATLRGLS